MTKENIREAVKVQIKNLGFDEVSSSCSNSLAYYYSENFNFENISSLVVKVENVKTNCVCVIDNDCKQKYDEVTFEIEVGFKNGLKIFDFAKEQFNIRKVGK